MENEFRLIRKSRGCCRPRASVFEKMSAASGAGYEEIAACRVAGVPISKYRSQKTGLVVCIVQVEGPLVNGYFCLGEVVVVVYLAI